MRVLALSLFFLALAAAPAPGGAPVGSAGPAITATTLDGAPLPAGMTAGKVVVLNFWATWCPPCRSETPDLIAAYHQLHGPHVAFLGVDTTETGPIVKTFLSAKGVPYPSALAGPDLYNAYGISYIPTTVVLDAHGVVRARWIGGVTPAQLRGYIDAAKAGRSAVFVSAAQAQIDRLLAPAQYHFNASSAATRTAAVAAMNAAIAKAETIASKDEASVDYERTQHAEGALRTIAGTAVLHAAHTDAQRVAGLTLLAKGEGQRNDWTAAVQTYRRALALAPNSPAIVAALSRGYYRLHDYPGMIAQAERYTELKPNDGDGWSDLGLAYQRTKRFAEAVPAYEKSIALLSADANKTKTQDAIADAADTSLDLANVYVSLGEQSDAQRVFAIANHYGDRLTPGGRYKGLKRNVKERTQEGMVAVALAGKGDKPVVSIAPWSGPDLPGSVASTLKYRLIVAAAADSDVTLEAAGLPKSWVASFCADGLCSPQTVSFRSPSTGVKTYEFQLIPPATGAQPGAVSVRVSGGEAVPVPPLH